MHASMIVPQSIYNGLTQDKIDIKLPSTMLNIYGNGRIIQELTSSSSPHFEQFPLWQFLVIEFEQYNPSTRSTMVFPLRLFLNISKL